jgi:hypothetical protein
MPAEILSAGIKKNTTFAPVFKEYNFDPTANSSSQFVFWLYLNSRVFRSPVSSLGSFVFL